eukprot:1276424-Amphidinium_carterae.1
MSFFGKNDQGFKKTDWRHCYGRWLCGVVSTSRKQLKLKPRFEVLSLLNLHMVVVSMVQQMLPCLTLLALAPQEIQIKAGDGMKRSRRRARCSTRQMRCRHHAHSHHSCD